MNFFHTSLLRVLAATALGHCLLLSAAANPYAEIAERNSFGLLQPVEPTPPPPNILAPASRLEVIGVVTVGGPRVLVTLQIPANPHTGQPARSTRCQSISPDKNA